VALRQHCHDTKSAVSAGTVEAHNDCRCVYRGTKQHARLHSALDNVNALRQSQLTAGQMCGTSSGSGSCARMRAPILAGLVSLHDGALVELRYDRCEGEPVGPRRSQHLRPCEFELSHDVEDIVAFFYRSCSQAGASLRARPLCCGTRGPGPRRGLATSRAAELRVHVWQAVCEAGHAPPICAMCALRGVRCDTS
jgi:hypothetical protein